VNPAIPQQHHVQRDEGDGDGDQRLPGEHLDEGAIPFPAQRPADQLGQPLKPYLDEQPNTIELRA
jgi:hypothetical protein